MLLPSARTVRTSCADLPLRDIFVFAAGDEASDDATSQADIDGETRRIRKMMPKVEPGGIVMVRPEGFET